MNGSDTTRPRTITYGRMLVLAQRRHAARLQAAQAAAARVHAASQHTRVA